MKRFLEWLDENSESLFSLAAVIFFVGFMALVVYAAAHRSHDIAKKVMGPSLKKAGKEYPGITD